MIDSSLSSSNGESHVSHGNGAIDTKPEVDGGSESHVSHSSGRWSALYTKLSYVPPRCRYDPDKPFEFSMGLNILFGKYSILVDPETKC